MLKRRWNSNGGWKKSIYAGMSLTSSEYALWCTHEKMWVGKMFCKVISLRERNLFLWVKILMQKNDLGFDHIWGICLFRIQAPSNKVYIKKWMIIKVTNMEESLIMEIVRLITERPTRQLPDYLSSLCCFNWLIK